MSVDEAKWSSTELKRHRHSPLVTERIRYSWNKVEIKTVKPKLSTVEMLHMES